MSSTSTLEVDSFTTIDFITTPEVIVIIETTSASPPPEQSSSQPPTSSPRPTSLASTRAPSSTTTSAAAGAETRNDTTADGGHSHDRVFATCPKFRIDEGEFVLNADAKSVFIPAYNATLNYTQFEAVDRGLVICLAGLAEESGSTRSKFGAAMGYITFAGLGVSIVCLLLHVAATIVAPELQNLSGKNLLSLCLALLGGYICFMANMFDAGSGGEEEEEDNGDVPSFGCVVLAVTMYYFFLASFFWMLAIAFDVCRTLKMATTQLRLTAGAQWKKFCIYSCLAWVAPLVLSVAAVAVDANVASVPEFLRPHFGESELCWFGSKRALLIFFAGPFALVMAANVFLFVSSACVVYDTTKSTTGKSTSCGPRTNFHLYLRLAVIMGLTWIVGLVAALIDVEEVWFAFVALSTTQGLFIFVSFTCNRKVAASLKARLCGGTYSPSEARTGPGGVRRYANRMRPGQMTSSSSSGTKRSDLSSSSNVVSLQTPRHRKVDGISFSSRGKTMYTVSKYQASSEITQNSFDGRYY